MITEVFFPNNLRKLLVTGHYGSGKTEFAISLAMYIAGNPSEASRPGSGQALPSSLAVVDLDIVNPYFRIRERRDMLTTAGVPVYGSIYKEEITAEIPALAANIRAPLEDPNCRVIIDAGGNDTGALTLNQFKKYFTTNDTLSVAIVNASRPETRDVTGAVEHIKAIESATGLTITGIVNNTHLLRETTADTIYSGHELCEQICAMTGKTLLCDCYPAPLIAPKDLTNLSDTLFPIGLHMRPKWLDRE